MNPMGKFITLAGRVLKEGRFMIILFNARNSLSWEYLSAFRQESAECLLEYKGHFPLSYSAGSVVQDTRNGSLKNDLALVFQKRGTGTSGMDRGRKLQCIEGWSEAIPAGQEE